MFNSNEKEYLRALVEKELEKFQKEESTVINNMSPGFLAGEKKYEEFLEELLEKLK